METWEIVFTSILGSFSLVVVLSYLSKSLVTQWLTKDIEFYKKELKLESDKAIEELKYTLQMQAFEHQVRFNYIHETRAKVIADLYSKIVVTQRDVEKFVVKWSSDQKPFFEIAQKIDELRLFFSEHRIYFEADLSDQIEELIQIIWTPVVDIHVYVKVDNPNAHKEKWEALKRAVKSIESNGTISSVRKNLEDEFRNLIGVGKQNGHPTTP